VVRLTEYIVVIFVFAMIGSILPFIKKWRSDLLHLFIAFGAGVFLGAVFFHLLPDVSASKDVFVFVLAGFLFVLLFEQFTAKHHDVDCGPDCPHKHDVVGLSAFVGLTIHSLTEGFGLGVGALTNPALGLVIFIAIIAHKAVGSFSLATVLRLSSFSTKKSMTLLVIHALMTPIGALVAYKLISSLFGGASAVATALAAGTFLYVATMDLLPEAFHLHSRRGWATLSMLFGLVLMFAITLLGA